MSTFDKKEDEEFWKAVAKQLSHEEAQPDTCDDEEKVCVCVCACVCVVCSLCVC